MGSDLFSNYTVEKAPFLQGGYMKLWKIFHGTHKVRKQEVCVFVFDKKSLDKFPKSEHNEILLTLKCEAHMLVKFKHPSLLSVVEPFVEDKNSLGFVTERFEYTLNSWMSATKPSKLEIKQMVIELAKAILFLHNDAHVVHNNLNPDNIFIDVNNKIKISGMSFCVEDPPLQGGDIDISKYTPNAIQNINPQNNVLSLPDLSFTAPELVFNHKSFYSCDMFSLGLILYQILKDHLGDTKSHLFMKLSSNSINTYKNFFNSYESYLSSKLKFENDDNFLLSKLLQKEQSARPRVGEIIETPWFNDPKLKVLNFIMNLESNDQKKNIEFLEKLPKLIGMFENKIITKRFLPALLKAIKVETLINPCLPAIFSICETPSLNISFGKEIWPKLRDLFKLRSLPAAAIYFLISKVQFIGEHISQSEFSQYFLNLICKAMDCNVPKIQFVVSNNMKFIAKSVDSLSFKNQIFPRMMQIVSSTNSKTLKIDMLNNIKSLYTKLDQNLINDKLLGTLEKVRKTDSNNDVCMCICDIYLEIAKIVNLEGIANKILPNLISMLVTANITKSNFDKIMGLITTYLDQIKKNRYNELINDGATLNVDSLASNKTNNNDFNLNSNKDDDNFMDSLLASSKPITTTNTNTNTKANDDFLNNLMGSNTSSTFTNNNTNTSNNNNLKNDFTSFGTSNNSTSKINNMNNDFTSFGTNKNNISGNNNDNSNQFDFDFGGNSSSNKKNDLFAGVSNSNNYNIPAKSNNNDLFSNMNINNNTNNNNKNKGDLLNNLMKDLPSGNNMNNNYGGNNNNNFNNFGNNYGGGNNNNNLYNMNLGNNNNKSSNPFDSLDNNNNNNNDNNTGGIGNTINFDFGLNTNNKSSKSSSNTNNTFMNFNNNTNSNNNNNFGGLNFGFNNNNQKNNNMNNNNSNDFFNFMGNNNNNQNNNNNIGFSFV